jgi:chromosome segregation ATPase
VVKLVRKLAKEQHSANLLQLAGKIAAVMRFGSSAGEDPFEKVKNLIKDMIEKLTAEAQQELTEKEYCDRERAHTKDKKEELSTAIDTLTAKIDEAVAKKGQLKEEVAQLQKDLAELQKMQLEMDKIRAEEHAAFNDLRNDLQAGIDGVRGAMEVLHEHYGSAAAFLQLKQDTSPIVDPEPIGPAIQPPVPEPPTPEIQPPVPEIEPPTPEIQPPVPEPIGPLEKPFPIPRPGPCPATSPSQGHGEAILDLLEVVESDFSRSLAQAQTDEDSAQAEYESTSKMNSEDKIQKEMDVKYKSKEIVRLENSISSLTSDLAGTRSEYEAILDYWKTLTDKCVAKPESYEERKRRREAEIAGLKEALRILTEEAAMVQMGKTSLRGVRRHS